MPHAQYKEYPVAGERDENSLRQVLLKRIRLEQMLRSRQQGLPELASQDVSRSVCRTPSEHEFLPEGGTNPLRSRDS